MLEFSCFLELFIECSTIYETKSVFHSELSLNMVDCWVKNTLHFMIYRLGLFRQFESGNRANFQTVQVLEGIESVGLWDVELNWNSNTKMYVSFVSRFVTTHFLANTRTWAKNFTHCRCLYDVKRISPTYALNDWFQAILATYSLSYKIHAVSFGLSPWRHFQHSDIHTNTYRHTYTRWVKIINMRFVPSVI